MPLHCPDGSVPMLRGKGGSREESEEGSGHLGLIVYMDSHKSGNAEFRCSDN